jgi:hypothetical protein
MALTRRLAIVALLSVAWTSIHPPVTRAEKVYSPSSGSCIADDKGGPNNTAPLSSRSLQQAPQQCTATRTVYNQFPLPHLDDDIDLLLSGNYFSTGYPYMNNDRINVYVKSLDADSANEFHKPWRDFQLNFNYFQGAAPTGYYSTFGLGSPNMDFELPGVPDNEERHVDIYLNHPNDGLRSQYPYQGPAEPREDGSPSSCTDDYNANSISVDAGFKTTVGSCAWISSQDPNWHASGDRVSLVTQHEFQHLASASRGANSGPGFPNEMQSQTAEYLVGASVRDAQRAILNSVYDRGLVNVDSPDGFDIHHYTNWYLWGIYLSQHFAADTTQVEDDLIYKWVRNRNELGVYDQQMHGLAHVLEAPEYAGLGGATGSARLRNLYHNYVLAKWIDNPSPSFYSGRLGFGRGINPYETPGYFDNSFAPFAKNSANEVPPRFNVGQARVASDSTYAIGGVWQVTDESACGQRVSADTIGIWLYGSDYIQFDADDYFTSNGKQNTFHFRMNWDPAKYPGGGSLNSLRVAAIKYSVKGDSLYRKGQYVTGIQYAFVDSLHGFAQLWVPNFGTDTKSVVVSIDMGEVNPPGSGRNPRKLYYGYSFGVDAVRPAPGALFNATATLIGQSIGRDTVRVQWNDPGICGSGGYTLQQSWNNTQTWISVGSVPNGTFQFTWNHARNVLYFYRVIAGSSPACTSSVATIGGATYPNPSIGGNVYLAGDIFVGLDHTLTILPGSMVRCATSDTRQMGYDTGRVEVIVDGYLEAIGTESDSIRWTSASATPAPGSWGGIITKAPGHDNHLTYNAISYAYHGIKAEGNDTLFVDHCAIRHSQFYGVYAFNQSKAVVKNSILEQNHGAETAAAAASTMNVRYSFLRYSVSLGGGVLDDGAVYSASSGGNFRRNRLIGHGMGLYCVGYGSSPTLQGEAESPDSLKWGRNEILNFQNYGVRTYDEAAPILGTTQQPDDTHAGRNNIYSTAYPSAIWVSHWATGSPELQARYNYWGASTPNPARFSGNINGDTESNSYLALFENASGPNPHQYYPGYQAAGSLTVPETLFAAALRKEISGDDAGAVIAYRALVTSYPNDPEAPRALFRLLALQMQNRNAQDEIEYTGILADQASSSELRRVAKRSRPALLLFAGMFDDGLRAYDVLLEDSAYDRAGVLFEMALMKGLVLHDAAGARAAVNLLQDASRDYYLLKHARAMLQEVVGSDIWVAVSEPRAGQSANGSEISGGLGLEQNYPNPSNPRTSLAFNLPSRGRVRLQIFDVRGRLVRTLVDAALESGRHEISWDGRTNEGKVVSSGVYHYRLEFGGVSSSRKLIMLK